MNEIEETKGNFRQAVKQSASRVLAKDPGTEAVSNRATRRREEKSYGERTSRASVAGYHPDWTD